MNSAERGVRNLSHHRPIKALFTEYSDMVPKRNAANHKSFNNYSRVTNPHQPIPKMIIKLKKNKIKQNQSNKKIK